MIGVASAGGDLLTVTSLFINCVQLLSEVKKSSRKAEIVVHHGADKIPVPLDSDQALLERLLRERLPEKLDPAQITINHRSPADAVRFLADAWKGAQTHGELLQLFAVDAALFRAYPEISMELFRGFEWVDAALVRD